MRIKHMYTLDVARSMTNDRKVAMIYEENSFQMILLRRESFFGEKKKKKEINNNIWRELACERIFP